MKKNILFIMIILMGSSIILHSSEKEGLGLLLTKINPKLNEVYYSDNISAQVLDFINNKNYDSAIIYLMDYTKDDKKINELENAYIDLIYLLAINKRHNESLFFLEELKAEFPNYNKEYDEWLDFIEIFDKLNLNTKQYNILELLDNYLNKYKDSIWAETILYLKAQENKIIDYGIGVADCYVEIYNLNKNSFYFEEMYPVLKNYFDSRDEYSKSEELIIRYINKFQKKKKLDSEYFWLAQYYDSTNQKRKAKKYYLKLAEDKSSAIYPEAIYWLSTYYSNTSKKKGLAYFTELLNYEEYKDIAEKKIELLKNK